MNVNFLSQLESTTKIVIYGKTWNRDSHGLYDFESSSLKPFCAQVDENSALVRREKNHEIKYLQEKEYELGKSQMKEGDNLLANLQIINGKQILLIFRQGVFAEGYWNQLAN